MNRKFLSNRKLNERFLIDKLTANLVMRSDIEVVDRNNLKKLFEEYRLGKETFTDSLGREHSIINPETIKELGNVYGIKGFILGEVTSAGHNSLSILLKMVSSDKGEIVWGKSLNINLPLSEAEGVVIKKTFLLTLALAAISFPCWAAVNLEEVAKNAISSMVKTVKDPDLKHLGILSIQDETGKVDTEELGEILTYELVNDGRFQVVERNLLDELIKEVKYEKESGYFDQKKAGGIKGIDGLLVGRVYQAEEGSPILILKLLDLERQSLAWMLEINLGKEDVPFKMAADAISSSVKEAEVRLKAAGIERIALRNISNNTGIKLNRSFIVDKLAPFRKAKK